MNHASEVLEPDPVFVDPSGRRGRLMRNAGIVVGCVLAGYLIIVTFGVVTGTRVPLTPWPDDKHSGHHALPGHGRLIPKQGPTGPAGNPSGGRLPFGVAPSGSPGTSPSGGPGGRTTVTPTVSGKPTASSRPTGSAAPTATAPTSTVPTTATTAPGNGHGHTKSPRPKKS